MTTTNAEVQAHDTPQTHPGAASRQEAHNAQAWAEGRYVQTYAHNRLEPAEVRIFVEHREALSGRVLDIGCGAGRVLAYLVMMGADAVGVDLAPNMVEHCRQAVPGATVTLGDVSDLHSCVEGTFTAVLAPDNLIDVFDDGARRRVLRDIHDLLEPGGLFIFTSHDLGWLEANSGPREWEKPSASDKLRKLSHLSVAGVVQAIRNRREIRSNQRRLQPLQETNADHSIVNDFPHNYGLLHYYIRRDDQQRQLVEQGFELLQCMSCSGRPVGPGGHSQDGDCLFYVTRRL